MRFIAIAIIFTTLTCSAQFDGAGGELGSKSIDKDNSSITAWASSAVIQRGKLQINQSNNSLATLGDSSSAIGPFDGNVLSLGDSGVVTLGFDEPIINSEGYDFAVFENGFRVGFSYYLELAHVEVSDNGTDFVRFPSESLSDTSYQTDNFGYTDPVKLKNLAGKHQAPYGTLFDLEEIGLDQINYIRIVDVIGSVNDSFGTRDSKGRIINDPWPTPFASSGFDLDAVAVVNGSLLNTQEIELAGVKVYPSLARVNEPIHISGQEDMSIEVFNQRGQTILKTNETEIKLDASGLYIFQVTLRDRVFTQKVVIR
ncbi:MAG: hypothetical protein ACJAR8_001435 [Bacteroidia bacterium]|jgi:hypothetical protein